MDSHGSSLRKLSFETTPTTSSWSLMSKSKSSSGGPDRRPIIIRLEDNKPSGFDRARRAKSGLYQCVYDCDEYFRTVEESRNHTDCPNREKCEKDLLKMESTLVPDGFKYVPKKTWSPDETRKFESFLRHLPKTPKNVSIQEYLVKVEEEKTKSQDQDP